uniref:Trypsin-like n=1 Tax=Sinocyclocheilus grahami TaxID=75366 RepID=A0A672S2F7_SINGR
MSELVRLATNIYVDLISHIEYPLILFFSSVCGRAPLNPKIVGGQNAVRGSWPWQASINYVPNGGLVCGGSLINKDWVLSAAQCFQELTASTTVIYLGRQWQIGTNSHQISRTVTQIIIHPKYHPDTFDNDIALVQLSSSVTFNDYIRPVCLAAAGSTFAAGTESWITGWGKLNFGDTTLPNTLQEVKIPVISNSYCKSVYESIFTDNILCAGPIEGGKGLCQGDGGGPLVINGSQWIQSGITSFSVQCTAPKYPGGYTRVSRYQHWISSHIKSDLPGFVEFKSSGFRSSNSLPLFSISLTFSIFPLIFSLFC